MKREERKMKKEKRYHACGVAKKEKRTREKEREWKIPLLIFFILIFSFFSFMSCPANIDNPPPSATDGMGAITLLLADNNVMMSARTILPPNDALDLGDLNAFLLDFQNADGVNHKIVERTDTTISESVILVAGTYTLTIYAYINNTIAIGNLRARETINFTITPGEQITRNLTLRAVLDDGEGTFAWNVSFNTSTITITSASMTILDKSGNQIASNPVTTFSPPTAHNSDRSLDSGVYTVVFDLAGYVNDADTHIPGTTEKQVAVTWHELLYVYSSLTSTCTITFNDEFFYRTHYKVTFVHQNAFSQTGDTRVDPTTATHSQSFFHGDTIANAAPTIPANPLRHGHRFDGWLIDNNVAWDAGTYASVPRWNFADPIYRDMVLYAGWTPNQLFITLTVEQVTEKAPTPPTITTISRSASGGFPSTANVNITGTYASISWQILGASSFAGTIAKSGTTAAISLNANETNAGGILIYSLGYHTIRITVTVNETIDGLGTVEPREYSANFRFRVIE